MVSTLRVLVFAAIISPLALLTAGPATVAAAIVFGLCGWLMLRGMSEEDMPPNTVRNPFEIKPLVLFAVIFAVVAVVSVLSSRYFGNSGLAVTTAISGMVDVDVAVLSVLRLSGGLSNHLVGEALLAALASNALVRFLGGAAVGPREFSLPLAGVNVAAATAGVVAYFLVPTLAGSAGAG
jgi:uncharacterized membrane protein (DUF4010 family)